MQATYRIIRIISTYLFSELAELGSTYFRGGTYFREVLIFGGIFTAGETVIMY